MTTAPVLWRWRDGGWEPTEDTGELFVIDSWQVRDGGVHRFDLHMARFLQACREIGGGVSLLSVQAALDSLPQLWPTSGDWFPRIELVRTDGEWAVQWRLRASPAISDSITLWVAGVNRATQPRIKGADLNYYIDAREQALSYGADDAVFVDTDGYVLESATTAVVWWEAETLCVPASPEVLGSVTSQWVTEALQNRGFYVAPATATPAELIGREVWALNALHGIRVVTGWVLQPGGIHASTTASQPHRRLRQLLQDGGDSERYPEPN